MGLRCDTRGAGGLGRGWRGTSDGDHRRHDFPCGGLPGDARVQRSGNVSAPLEPARGEIAPRRVTAVLVAVLAAGAGLLGPFFGGMLAGLPVLASVLAVFTHRRHGPAVLVALLRGMLIGMAGFVGFCAIVSLSIVPAGIGPAFVTATLAAVGLQALVADRPPGGRWALRAQERLSPYALRRN